MDPKNSHLTSSLSEILLREADHATVTAAFFLRDGKILIGLRHYASGPVWTTPGGKCHAGETIESGIRRETLEEIGIKNFDIFAYLGSVKAATIDSIVHVFICESEQEARLMEDDKFSCWKWEPLDSIPENFINPPALELVRTSIMG